ncbi:MAG TPA: RHS repeat-associated core domain-containing protein [Bacteroidales bacterium]|nr:RHS repeat-associated core domain-containing protein [Bacteroidales bacterium]
MKIKTLIKLLSLLFFIAVNLCDSYAQKRPKEYYIKWGINDNISYYIGNENPGGGCPSVSGLNRSSYGNSPQLFNYYYDPYIFEIINDAHPRNCDCSYYDPLTGDILNPSYLWYDDDRPPDLGTLGGVHCDPCLVGMPFMGGDEVTWFPGERPPDIKKPNIVGPAGLTVNSYSGGLFYQRQDLYIPGKGLSLDLTFSYNSTATALDFGYGPGWTMTYNMICKPEGGNITIRRGDGRKDSYVFNGIAYVPPEGVSDSLTEYQPGKYRLTTKYGINYFFDDLSHHRLTGITDPNYNEIHIVYTDSLPYMITDASGRSLYMSYLNGHLAEIFDMNTMPPRHISYAYDTNWNPVAVIGPEGDSIQYAYDAARSMIMLTDQLDNEFFISYINCSQVENIMAPMRQMHFSYDPSLLTTTLTEMVDTSMQSTTFRFDTDGNLREKAGGCCGYHQLYDYDVHNNLQQLTDANGNVYHFSFGAKSTLVQLIYPTGAISSWAYGPFNRVLSYTDANGNVYSAIYDASGNLLTLIKPLGIIEHFTYDAAGNVVSYTDGKGNVTQYIRNGYGYVTQIIYADGTTNSFTWDNAGNKLSYTDANSNTTNYIYDLANHMVQRNDALGFPTFFVYNGRGELISETNALGQSITWAYDALGNITARTTPAGTSYRTFNAMGNIRTYTDNNGNVWNFFYNAQNLLSSLRNPLNKSRSFTYDANGNRLTQTDFIGNPTTFTYNTLNRLVQVTDALSNNTTLAYDNNGNLTSLTDGNSHTTTFVYDGLDRLTQVQRPIGIINYVYDANDNLTSVTDPLGHNTSFAYNNRDRMITMTDALSNSAAKVYDNEGNVISYTDRNGLTTSQTFDALGRNTSVTNPAGETSTYTYNAVSNMIAGSIPNGNNYTYNYDAAGRLTSFADNMGTLASYTYDANSNVLTAADAGGHTTLLTYDALNRLTQTTDPMGRPTIFGYNDNSSITSVQDRNSGITTHQYDNLEREISITYPAGNAITSAYDGTGNLTSATDDNGNTTTYSYDANDNLILETFADGTTKSYTYDAEDKITSRTDNNAAITYYSRDALHMLTGRNYPGANDDVYTYDNEGRMLTANNNNANISWSWDNAGRMLSENINGKTSTYTYNIPVGKRNITYPGGRAIEENFDLRQRLSLIKENSANMVSYAYDAGNRIVSRTYNNGAVAVYSYNNNDQMTALTHNSSGTLPPNIAGFNYTIDNEGNILTAQKSHHPANSEQYIYNPDNWLITYKEGTLAGGNIPSPLTQTQYNYDGVLNRTTTVKDGINTTYTVNSLNEYTAINSGTIINPTYDADGNTLADGTHTFTYDFENRLLTVDGGATATYTYDALGRRIRKVTPGGTVNYYFDKKKVIEERNATDVVQATYVYGTQLDDILHMRRSGTDYFYHQNVLGSVSAVTDVTGSVTERYEYDGYGNISIYDASYVPRSATAIGNTYMFTGREYDAETGYYYYRARTYNPLWGRFLQRDPVGIWLDEINIGNGYGYVGNNPIIRVDPNGDLFWVIAGVVVAGVALTVAVIDLVYEPAPSCVENQINPIRTYKEDCYVTKNITESSTSYQEQENAEGETRWVQVVTTKTTKKKVKGKRTIWERQKCVNGAWKDDTKKGKCVTP